MARILVAGSQGTLGRPLVEALRAKGNEVWVAICSISRMTTIFARLSAG